MEDVIMEKMSLDKVMRKIQKLKKLYEGAKKINSEGEAQNAAALIQKLLTEYNLTMEEVGSEQEKEDNKVMHENVSGFTYKSIGGIWEQRLTHVICKWNFCKCYIYGKSYKSLIIVGKKDNVEMVKWLLDILKERFVFFSKQRYKEYLKGVGEFEKPMGKEKFQRSYLVGCAMGLDSKLKEQHEREKKEEVELSTKITSLVVRNNAAVEEYVENEFGGTSKARRFHENYDSARYKGFEDGKNTDINKPIAGGRAAANNVKLLD